MRAFKGVHYYVREENINSRVINTMDISYHSMFTLLLAKTRDINCGTSLSSGGSQTTTRKR